MLLPYIPENARSLVCAVGLATNYRLDSGIQIVMEARAFLYSIIFQSSSGADTLSYSVGTRVLTTHLYLLLRVRVNGGKPLLFLYALRAWKGTILPFCLYIR
jgi:hypothetical protein